MAKGVETTRLEGFGHDLFRFILINGCGELPVRRFILRYALRQIVTKPVHFSYGIFHAPQNQFQNVN